MAIAACGGSPSSPSPSPAPSSVTWSYTGSAWQPSSTPPACVSPLIFPPPLDLAPVTSILYPGQTRGVYKPHGGFRLDGSGQTTDARVTMPTGGYVYRGSRYRQDGELQYLFDIINECGVMHRFDHLRVLSARFQAVADRFPAAQEGDTRTTFVTGEQVAAGDLVATGIGVPGNVGMDWGVYDLRSHNSTSRDGELEGHFVCWFDNLPPDDAARVRSLPPGDGQAGRTSDVCR